MLLVFLVLIYVQPLRAMARSFSTFLGGGGTPFGGDVGDLFLIYGAGFVAMAATTAALFVEAQRNPALDGRAARPCAARCCIWLILVADRPRLDRCSTAFEATEDFAPLALCDAADHDRPVHLALRLGAARGRGGDGDD